VLRAESGQVAPASGGAADGAPSAPAAGASASVSPAV
jgi:hypothetical protein